ncbi:hypothetical protein [Paenibacillus arenilitoris]|uniref:hypothetical protein n=1 Tax=Paenibacillus arenilitoris TaxID=2772299 RepID=UPI0021E0F827|nr:hypothetical protein [Paenibacillus arenilitoris]
MRALAASLAEESASAEKDPASEYAPSQGYIRNKIGYTAALSLLRIGGHAAAGGTVGVLERALGSADRYVRAYACEALDHLRTAEAVDVLLRYYRSARWCPDTTKASTF